MNLTCPIDNKDDSIQKVSAVVASGQSSGTFSGPTGGTVSYDGKTGSVSGYSSLSGSSISNLAQLLGHPREPNKPVGFGLAWLYLWAVGFVLGTALSILPVIVIFIISSSSTFACSSPFIPSSPSPTLLLPFLQCSHHSDLLAFSFPLPFFPIFIAFSLHNLHCICNLHYFVLFKELCS